MRWSDVPQVLLQADPRPARGCCIQPENSIYQPSFAERPSAAGMQSRGFGAEPLFVAISRYVGLRSGLVMPSADTFLPEV